MTTSQRFLIAITLLNGAFTLLSVSQVQHANAAGDGAGVLRGRGLEIVDESGRVRASIKVHPADPKVRMPDGTTQTDSAVFRLINPDGRPGVKLGTSENNAGIAFIARQGDYLQVFADGVKLTRDGRQQAAWP
jgi:hypothetical protein